MKIRDGFSVMRQVLAAFTVLFLLGLAGPGTEARGEPNLVTAIQDVARKNIPAVVHVEVTEKQHVANPLMPFFDDPFYRYFFGNPKKAPKGLEREVTGLGSGIIMDAQGNILTNSHVVGGATRIRVVLSDGRRFTEESVKLIGNDPKTDLAVIRIIDKGSFPYVVFGDSDKADVGQWVVAIGHPQGLDQTVTQGIISAKHRRGMADPTSYQDFLQTDAAINPGNSGGPLLNLEGEVIGVNAAIVSQSGGFEGIGFAIPSNMAVHVAKQLISSGKVERGWLGVAVQDLTQELARSFGLPNTKGVLIANVVKGGPAERAGLRQGDVVVQYEGIELRDSSDFRNRVAAAPLSRDVIVTILRDGKRLDISVRAASEQKQEQALLETVRARYGVSVRELKETDLGRGRREHGMKGVIVAKVIPRGPFAKAGIETGDIIVQINDQRIETAEEFATALEALPQKKKIIIGLVDHRTGESGFVRMIAP